MNFNLIATAGLTQKEFADVCGVSRTTVNLWSNGKMKPHRFIAARIKLVLAALERAVDEGELPLERAAPGEDRAQTIRALLRANKTPA